MRTGHLPDGSLIVVDEAEAEKAPFDLEAAILAGAIPKRLLRALGRERDRRGQAPEARDRIVSSAEAKRARRRDRNLSRG